MTVEILSPHGLCAGVNVALAKALRERDVWCLHELIHNELVIAELKGLGYRFVESIEDVPEGGTVVFSAHGVSPSVRARAAARGLSVVDTTCPFVARVHAAARAYSERGLPVVLLGDARHAEVKGIRGECADVRIVECSVVMAAGGSVAGIAAGTKIGVVSQTTLNAAEVASAVQALQLHYDVETMADVCQATRERQEAVRRFSSVGAGRAVLVLGSRTSSNSRRLAEVAEEAGIRAYMAGNIDEFEAIHKDLLRYERVGVTSGASTPETFFDDVLSRLNGKI